jgi:DNA-binding MarR family transcriptional regulator
MKGAPRDASGSKAAISPAEYETLAEFRHQIASFLRRRREAAEAAGLEPQQYELLLAIKGAPDGTHPNIKQIAQQLLLQHHSAVELTGRLEKRGLVQRQRSATDRRSVLVSVTKAGDRIMEQVVQFSLSQLQLEGPQLLKTLGRLVKPKRKSK